MSLWSHREMLARIKDATAVCIVWDAIDSRHSPNIKKKIDIPEHKPVQTQHSLSVSTLINLPFFLSLSLSLSLSNDGSVGTLSSLN